MNLGDLRISIHARQRWDFRFSDQGRSIEHELESSWEASPKVRRIMSERGPSHSARARSNGTRIGYRVTRLCIFPYVIDGGVKVVMTVIDRRGTDA